MDDSVSDQLAIQLNTAFYHHKCMCITRVVSHLTTRIQRSNICHAMHASLVWLTCLLEMRFYLRFILNGNRPSLWACINLQDFWLGWFIISAWIFRVYHTYMHQMLRLLESSSFSMLLLLQLAYWTCGEDLRLRHGGGRICTVFNQVKTCTHMPFPTIQTAA